MYKPILRKHYLLIVILILSAFLRLYKISGYMEFLGDQGRDVVIVRNFLQTGRPPFIGPQTSIGNMYLGPYFYYLIAPALLFANLNPVGPSIFIALLGVATVFLVYFVCNLWFNRQSALLASFLYAISPVVIKYSNFSWNPNIMPFFALLFIYFTTNSLIKHKYRQLNYASLAFIMTLNSHYLALLLLPVAGILWVIQFYRLYKAQDNKNIKYLLTNTFTAVIIFILSLTPLILFDIKHHGQNIQAIINFFSHRETTVNIKPYKALPIIPSLFNQINTRLLAGKNDFFGMVSSLIFIFGLIVYFIKKKSKINIYFLVCLLWYFSGLVGLGLYKQHIYDHYFGFLFPVVFILLAVVIDMFLFQKIYLKLTAAALIIGLTFFSLIENPFRYPPNNQLSSTIKISELIKLKSNNQEFNLALLAKQNYDPPYRYFLNLNKAKLYTLNEKMTNQLFVICEPWQMDCQPINNPLWDIAAFGWSKVDSQWQIGDIKIFKLIHTKS